jgi:hypothetical protein
MQVKNVIVSMHYHIHISFLSIYDHEQAFYDNQYNLYYASNKRIDKLSKILKINIIFVGN